MNRRELLKTGMGLAAMSLPGVAKAHEAEVKDHELPEAMLPRLVRMGPGFAPGEIHVNPIEFALYWTLPGGDAMRYIVGVGRPGLYESGEFYVGAKKEWPSWTPTPGMIDREPEKYAKYKDGMPGGIDNPLGARALYLFTPERGDTFLRIHGTNDPDTLGRRVSNGCARLVNSQIIELYDQVPMDTRVVLYPFA
ncbi:MAG: L,D-transpeptidase [Marinovum algicola]|jgi:lipoprotein-anchoring transpeptidase ErfK/SrfK|uniref:L,D-transpeptidase n=1 Tax=Marinovum TaxID=367771 RepID=UPI00065B1C05|nr:MULTISPECIES: L,D-transpeptidase [Marinovum]AKP00076.1 hypothetical protein MALG_04948 [Marinovum algicola DG 898]MDD9745158.1 L,D-transpeptidase [Marinovum sp. PR37]